MNQPVMVQLLCSNCFWFREIREDATGTCWRHPPQIVVMFGRQTDLASAQQQTVQAPTKVRPTMRPDECCGDFSPRPDLLEPHPDAKDAH